MTANRQRGPLFILANFASPLTGDLGRHALVRQWSAQAPREIWSAHAGDVLVTPVPLSDDFHAYACTLLGLPSSAVEVVTVPELPGRPMAEAICRDGVERLRKLAGRRPGARMMPLALDGPTVALADELGLPLHPYDHHRPGPDAGTLAAVEALNTKSGFRAVAHDLGVRLPHGRVCAGPDLPVAVRSLVGEHGRVVVKPDRSAGGHGLRFVDGDGPPVAAGTGTWVVEECVAGDTAVSTQFESRPGGPRHMFTGEMTLHRGRFAGYRAPARSLPVHALDDLRRWARALGHHLAAHGYLGPYAVDAVVSPTGAVYATECNVRRTATTAPQETVARLGGGTRPRPPAWQTGRAPSGACTTFAAALREVRDAGLAYSARTGEGVILHADHGAPGTFLPYLAVAADPPRAAELASRLVRTLGSPTEAGGPGAG